MTTPDIHRAQNALAAFDEANLNIDAAWWSLEDDDDWTFYVHTTLYDVPRPQMYTKLFEALTRFPGALPLEEIKLLPERSDLLTALRSTYSFGLDSPILSESEPTVHLHVADSTIGGHFVRWLIIYRLT